jgi:hypothetical protein
MSESVGVGITVINAIVGIGDGGIKFCRTLAATGVGMIVGVDVGPLHVAPVNVVLHPDGQYSLIHWVLSVEHVSRVLDTVVLHRETPGVHPLFVGAGAQTLPVQPKSQRRDLTYDPVSLQVYIYPTVPVPSSSHFDCLPVHWAVALQ